MFVSNDADYIVLLLQHNIIKDYCDKWNIMVNVEKGKGNDSVLPNECDRTSSIQRQTSNINCIAALSLKW